MKERIEKLLKKRKMLSVITSIALVLLLIYVILMLLFKNDTYATKNENFLTVTCPEFVQAGSEFECSIVLSSSTITTQGISSNFSIADALTFINFTAKTGWNSYTVDSDGFAIVNFTGLSGSDEIGKVKLQLTDSATYNSSYTFGLNNVKISDGNQTYALDSKSTTIKTLSDINTLSTITLSTGTLNEEVNNDVTEYTATVNSDKVTISVTKTDENSTVEGAGEVSLHYGTNIVNIKVTSQAGTAKNYKISIEKPFEFTSNNCSDKYTYNKNGNYLYTKTDTLDSAIKSNLNLPTGLTSSINNNKLTISYNTEKLLNITIANISSSKYTIASNKIYIDNNLLYSDFIDNNNFISNGVTVKIFNGNNEITAGALEENYKLKVYYGSTVLDEYSFVINDYLNIDNDLDVQDTNKIIGRVKAGNPYEELLAKIDTNGTKDLKARDSNQPITNTSKVRTGDIIEIKLTDTTYRYTVSVLGDINGDGEINVGDVGLLYNNLKGKKELENYQIAAGNILNDGSIKINDVARLYKYIKKKDTESPITLEVE